ncbi:hypothetical protein INR49_022240 [Caranx melampygus]|nr:hypothetical protein INR49_022240 [Caranx melampygus]
MSTDEVTRPRTRKTCEVPPAFVLLKEREEGERGGGTERRAEQTADTDQDPPDTSCLRPENTLTERTHCSLTGQTIITATSVFRRSILVHPSSAAKDSKPKDCAAPGT